MPQRFQRKSSKMATNYLGPETPSPFSVISESYSNFYNLPKVPEFEQFRFGQEYERSLKSLIHRYLELGTDHRLCYVGHSKGSLAGYLQEQFCLLQPITSVIPGHIHYEETPNKKMVPVKIAHVGADEFFRQEAKNNSQFDRILLMDAIDYLTEPQETYKNIMKTIKNFGKLLIIHRPAPMNTLPLFSDAKSHMNNMDQSYMSIIQDLQSLNLDIQWEVECLPITMEKWKWMSMLKDKYPIHLEGMSNLDLRLGIRELSEGILKYEGQTIEFIDRLLFISASHRVVTSYPSIQRFGSNELCPFPGVDSLRYSMVLTPEMKRIVDKKKCRGNNRQRTK